MRYTVGRLQRAPKDRLVARIAAECWLVGDYLDTVETLRALVGDKSIWRWKDPIGWVSV